MTLELLIGSGMLLFFFGVSVTLVVLTVATTRKLLLAGGP